MYNKSMLKIRFQRIGRRKNPSFRIIVAQSTIGPKSGKFIEKLGFYNPIEKTKGIDKERVLHWIKQGAIMSDTAHNLFVSEKIIEGKKKNALPKKTPIKKDTPDAKEGDSSKKEEPQEKKTDDTTKETITDSGEDDSETPKSEKGE